MARFYQDPRVSCEDPGDSPWRRQSPKVREEIVTILMAVLSGHQRRPSFDRYDSGETGLEENEIHRWG
ncbi:hypothetical protein TIFTF001_024808 [Ficus carica]|uniref:Uncharacterized protein n=1 Tax=Ficus carica TaxID=3494 RepID=A0AA88AHI3_FICCA|nr:hypothetical protein TIFTF001_024808 [Ficus carica]